MPHKMTNDRNLLNAIPHSDSEYPVQVFFNDLSKLYMHRIRWHWHEEIEIIIINHGEADLLAEDLLIHLNPGQGVFINANILHSLHPSDTNTYNCSFYSVKFHPAYLFTHDNILFCRKFWNPVVTSPDFQIFALDEENHWQSRLLDCANEIIAANLTKRFGFEMITKSHLYHFWSILLEKADPGILSESRQVVLSMDEIRVKDAIKYIEAHYADAMTLQALSDSLHISKSECCRCFKRTLQITPIEYLAKYRIMKATEKLLVQQHKSQPISDLAYSVGFNNASYFNKVFKEYMECTPSAFLRKIKRDPLVTEESLSAIKF